MSDDIGSLVDISGTNTQGLLLARDDSTSTVLLCLVSEQLSNRSTSFQVDRNKFIYPNIVSTFWAHQISSADAEINIDVIRAVSLWPFAKPAERLRITASMGKSIAIGDLDATPSQEFYLQTDAFFEKSSEFLRAEQLGAQAAIGALTSPRESTYFALNGGRERYKLVLSVLSNLDQIRENLLQANPVARNQARILLRDAVEMRSQVAKTIRLDAPAAIAAFFERFEITALLIERGAVAALADAGEEFRKRYPALKLVECG